MKKLLTVFLLAIAANVTTHGVEAQVLVIANPGVAATEVSKSGLRDVFTGAATELKGAHVTPALLKSGAANDAFLSTYIGKGDGAFKAEWRSLVFSGQASMPKTLESETAMVEYVAHTSGAIGYVSSGAPHEGVKVLEVR